MATYFVQNTNSVEDIEQMNNVIDKVNKVNTTATSNIGQLTDLNNKAQELSNNIQQALPINTELKENIKIGQPLVQEAIEKNTELQASLEKTKEFIDGLDGSQDIPGIRMELTELQNGLKSNQALEYNGSSISAENTLEGRTAGMIIEGRTLVNLGERNLKKTPSLVVDEPVTFLDNYNRMTIKLNVQPNKKITINRISDGRFYTIFADINNNRIAGYDSWVTENIKIIIVPDNVYYTYIVFEKVPQSTITSLEESKFIVLEGEWTNKDIPSYFEGIKSFGEAEQEGDKYKISILSCGKNLFNCNLLTPSSDQITNFKIDGSIISGNFNGQYNSTKSVEFAVTTKVKVLIKAYLKGCRLIINNCWLENGEFRSIIDTNNWSNNETQELLSSRIVYIDKNSSLRVENPHQSAHSFSVRDLICYKIDGTENESYLPYRQDKKDILIKEPLRGIDNIQDIMYEDNGQVKVNRKVGKYTFTGDEGWTLGTQSSGWGEFDDTLVFYLDPFKAKTNTRFICDKFAYKNVVNINEVGIYNNVWGNKPHPVIRIKKSELSTPDLEGFKSWLKTNPTTMIYQLTTPVVEVVDGVIDIDLDTYQEKTYFNILNSLPGTLDFKVPSNIGSVVQNMAKEVNSIWDVINNLLVPGLIDVNKTVAMATIKNNLQ